MPYYVVETREVHIQGWFIEAKDELEAKDKVRGAEGVIIEAQFEYSHTLDTDLWTIREPTEEEIKQYGD